MEKIQINKLNETILHEKLKNGLDVYMIQNKKVNNFYITLTCRYGSIYDEFQVGNKIIKVPYGIAHFLEHVKFNEGKNKTAHEYFNKLGSFYNAYTTYDFTTYEVMSSTYFEENLSHLIKYVSNLYLTNEIVEKEKNIICEEIRMGKNNSGSKMFYGSKKALLKNDKRKNLITGEIKDVISTTKLDLENVFNYFYHPQNMFLVITGNFNPDDAIKIINKEYKEIKPKEVEKAVPKIVEESMIIPSPKKVLYTNVELPKVKISYKMERKMFENIDDDTLQVYIDAILHNNFGSTSLFREKLMDEKLISFLSASSDVSHNLIIISIVFESQDEDKEKIIEMILNNLTEMSISEDDINRYGRVNIASLINSYDDIEYVNSDIIDQIIRNKKINNNYFDLFNSLSKEQANLVLSNLDFSNKSIFYMLPSKEETK